MIKLLIKFNLVKLSPGIAASLTFNAFKNQSGMCVCLCWSEIVNGCVVSARLGHGARAVDLL